MASSKETPRAISPSAISEIEAILTQFLEGCDIVYPHDACLDSSYRDACYLDAQRRGFNLTILGKAALEVGVAIGGTSYRHLQNYSTRVFIATFTAVVVHLDDSVERYKEGMEDFVDRFLAHKRQKFEALDYLASLLREAPDHWGSFSSNIVTTAGMEFVPATVIENKLNDMEISLSMAPGFPRFIRGMCGLSRAYCIMGFPPELDLKTWIQVFPDLWLFIDYANDLFSFFKEELNGDSDNVISVCANSENISKIEVLKRLADETLESYRRGSQLLQSVPAAWEAYRAVCVGYVEFHAVSPRYKLDQLHL